MIKNMSTQMAVVAAFAALVFAISCQKKYPGNVESTDEVLLKSIKILNAGVNGNTVLEGVIDENKKTVWFPRIDPATNFDAIKFQAEMSDGAVLDKETYTFLFGENEDANTGIVKVVNNKRFREYLVTLRLLVPVFGADFDKPQVFDYSNNDNGNPVYPDLVGLNTRWTGFDGDKVLIVARTANGPHLLSVSDLKNNIINRIPLNLTGVAGGTFAYSSGAQINGHTYVCNLSTSAASPVKIYHWTNPGVPPTLIGEFIPANYNTAGARYGDNMSVDLDENGNGFIFFGDNNGGGTDIRDILRIKVSNYTTLSDPRSLTSQPGLSPWMTMTRVENSGNYLATGYYAPIYLMDESANLSFTLSTSSVPRNGVDARILSFNGSRYLITTTAARYAEEPSVVLYVYDISNGTTVKEAMEHFEQKPDKTAVFSYSLLGSVNSAPGTQSGYHIFKDADGKDEKLMLFASSASAGFVLVEFPKKTLDD